MNRVWTVVLVLGGCTSDKSETDTDPPTTDDGPTIETADTATEQPLPDLTGLYGSIALVQWLPDAYNEEANFTVGLFVDDDMGIVNLATCLLVGGQCIEGYPAVGDPGVEASDGAIYTNAINDVGELQVGGTTIQPDNSYGFAVYIADTAGLGGPGGISFDGEYAPYSGTDDYVVPDTMDVTAPDPSQAVAVTTGGVVDLAWASPGAGGVFLEVMSAAGATVPDTVVHLDDDGAHTILVDDLGFRQPFDTKALLLSRIETNDVDAAGNTVRIQARSDQWIYLEFSDTTGWTELVAGATAAEACADAAGLPVVGPGQFYGDLAAFADDHDLGDGNPVTNYATAGFDAVLPVAMLAGQTMTATFRQDLDGSIYVLDAGCDEGEPLAGADLTLDGDEEVLEFTALSDGTYHLVLDTWTPDAGSPFSLVLEIE